MNVVARRYVQAARETASPERLMVLLFQAALRNVRGGAAALEASRTKEGSELLVRAADIVMELRATLDRAKAPELCDTLAGIYQFAWRRLTAAALSRNPQGARDAERALAPVSDAFEQAVASLGAKASAR